jgi:glycosyltransferase involved in cell wall biosynthesis
VKKSIFVVSPWKRRWELGGTAGLADDYYFIREFANHGFNVHYVSPRYAGPRDVSEDNYAVHDFPDVLGATEHWPSLIRRPLWPPLFTACAVHRGMAAARRARPCFVLGQTHLSAWAAHILAWRLKVPSAVKLFGVENLDRSDWSQWKYLRKNLEQVLAFKVPQDAWMILDDGTKGDAAALRHGVARSRIRSLPNGINLEWTGHEADPDVLAQYGVPTDRPSVLFLARLIAWKRPSLFIQAIPRILEKSRRPVTFLVAGEGAEREPAEALAARLGVAESVRFLGAVSHEHVPHLLSAASVFVSTNDRTNAGIPTCEALVCGVPVVAFDVGNTNAVVRDGETGRLIPDGDIDRFADAVADLLNNDDERLRLGAHARLFAQNTFTGWSERVGMEIDIVNELTAQMRGGRGGG